MRTGTRLATWGVALALFAVVAFFVYHYVMSSALSTDCANTILEEATSPDHAYVATLFERNCGATGPYYRVVSLRSKGSKFDPDMQDDWIFNVKEHPDILLKWSDARHLLMRSHSSDENPMPRASWKDVTILRESPK